MIKCGICGKFISSSDINNNMVILHCQVDSEYTEEDIYYNHRKCEQLGRAPRWGESRLTTGTGPR